MDYAQAKKKVQADKRGENFLLIRLSYNCTLVLPYKEGVAFMATLSNAEYLEEEYGKPHKILGMKRDHVKSEILSRYEYERIKIAQLLGINHTELPEETAVFETNTT